MTAAEVLSVTKEQIAGMSDERVRAFRAEAAIIRSREDSKREEADSPIGMRMLQRRRDDLVTLRTKYASIKVVGCLDSDIVRNLIRWQAGEEYLLEDIAEMENANNYSEGVDMVIEICNDSITAREQGAGSNR